MYMNSATKTALIGGGVGALAGGIGGALIDKGAKREGNWLKRNKGAVIGALTGGAVGGTGGYFLGKIKDNKLSTVDKDARIATNKFKDDVEDSARKSLRSAEDRHNEVSDTLLNKKRENEKIYNKRLDALEDEFDNLYPGKKGSEDYAFQNAVKEREAYWAANKALKEHGEFKRKLEDYMPNHNYDEIFESNKKDLTRSINNNHQDSLNTGLTGLTALSLGAGAIGHKIASNKRKKREEESTKKYSFADYFDPIMRGAPTGIKYAPLIGAAGGAVLGGAAGYGLTKDKEKKKRNAIIGALTGAGLGYTGGAIYQNNELKKNLIDPKFIDPELKKRALAHAITAGGVATAGSIAAAKLSKKKKEEN